MTDSGSVFVQISDENVHHVREIMDEVFGCKNRIANIAYKVFGVRGGKFLDNTTDNIIWYGKDEKTTKYRQLYLNLDTSKQKEFEPVRLYRPGYSKGLSFDFEFEGKTYSPPSHMHWATGINGLRILEKQNRLIGFKSDVRYKRYSADFPCKILTTAWNDTWGEPEKHYVVQTSNKVIQRCILMTTDPGDLVFDPTCGSGTTAYVAEQWGRRWIACDTSRVALTLAKQRLMTATFDYYKLAYPDEGVSSGFEYKKVPHITLKSIANNEPPATETLFDQPLKDTKRARVTGPFTVEAVPAPTVMPIHPPSPYGRGTEGEGTSKVVTTPINPTLLKQARQLRKEQPDAEQLLWHLLINNNFYGFKFRRQHPVDPYVLDFYCPEAHLGIELDGGHHNEPDQQRKDKERTEFLIEQGVEVIRFRNNEVLQETEGVLEMLYDALSPTLSQSERGASFGLSRREGEVIADESVARSGETLRQQEWRDELLKAGIRGKSGQRITFSRVEPLPCRWLHADAETKPDDSGKDEIGDEATAYKPRRVVISFGPEHAPLEQRRVENALQEAATLMPKPEIVVFAAFQFDPEAAKDIDETNWPGVTMLKAHMNADMQTEDLKKKRAGNESFWLVGQPDVVVDSERWIVGSNRREALASYEIIKKLSGVDSPAKINGIDRGDLSLFIAIAERRDLWNAVATDAGGSVNSDSGEHSGGTSAGLPCRIGEADAFVSEIEILSERDRRNHIDRLRGNREIADRARQITASLPDNLSTTHYSQVTVQGFDYFNTKTGKLESGDADKIAVWMLDTDYDGRSLYPRQVFFPMADSNGGWTRLAKNLRAEIDEDMIEAYKGTQSLPFELGKNGRIAVKIVDDRGIESLKVVEIVEG